MSHVMYGEIQSRIMSLDIAPGERLTVDALAREFDVSPTPIREALSRLEADGLVSKTHLRGFRAAPQRTRSEFESMFELRVLIEPHAAARAAAGATDAQRREIQRAEEAMRALEPGQGGAGFRRFALLDARLHSLIAEAGGNPVIRETLDRLHVHLHLFRLRGDWQIADRALSEHRLIVQAVESREPLIAEAAMRSHLNHSLERTLDGFSGEDQSNSASARGA